VQLTRVAAALAALLVAAPAAANKYEVSISIENEQDLYDLHATGQIGDETLATLTELYQRGVDLNLATREELYSLPNLSYTDVDAILAYRALAGWIHDPAALVEAGVLSAPMLEAIAAFLVVSEPSAAAFATDGWLRAQTQWSVEDQGVPASALQARVATLQHLTVGFASAVTRNRLGDVRYDPTRDALSAAPADNRLAVPKFFAKWETPTWGAIAGTYRIGFGQRLTFDNTRLITPNGFQHDDQISRNSGLTVACKESQGELDVAPCTGAAGSIYVTPDYRWQDGLLGVAAGAKKLPLGPGHVEAFGFASYQPRDIYQYELYRKSEACPDPRDDGNPACAAPRVYRRGEDPLDPASTYKFSTLPDMFAETTVGGHVAYAGGRRSRLGVTGYTSAIDFLTEGIELDFQEWSRYPGGGRFGAVGVDGAIGIGKVDVFAEGTRSLDASEAGGGYGGLLRAVTSVSKRDELEASLRYYDQDFQNPYARAIAAADEVDGLRARDELGVRLRYTGTLDKRLTLRGSVDVWQTPSTERWNLVSYARGDLAVTDQYGVGLWLLQHDKEIGVGGRGQCFEVSTEEDEDGEAIPCSGQRYQVAARFRYTPMPRYTVTAQYQHELLDDGRYDDRYRQDVAVVLTGSARPSNELTLRARLRYLSEDISDDSYLERSLWSYLEAGYKIRARDWLRLRYDLYTYLDDRMSTAARVPSPEHRLWLEYESRF
jgi:hypothetical protein